VGSVRILKISHCGCYLVWLLNGLFGRLEAVFGAFEKVVVLGNMSVLLWCAGRGMRYVRSGRGEVFVNLVSVVSFFDGVLRWQS